MAPGLGWGFLRLEEYFHDFEYFARLFVGMLCISNRTFLWGYGMLYNRICGVEVGEGTEPPGTGSGGGGQSADDRVSGAGGLHAFAGAGVQDQPVFQAAGGGGVFA